MSCGYSGGQRLAASFTPDWLASAFQKTKKKIMILIKKEKI
jgi:hypothetical protein